MTEWWADVPAARALPVARRIAERAQLVALVAGPVRSTIWRPLALAAGGVALATATGAAFAFFGTEEATDRSVVQCHTTVEAARGVDFDGAGVELRGPVEQGDGERAVPIQDAVDRCADLWKQGVLRLGAPNAQLPTGQVEEVPPLTACLTEHGVASVFPTDLDVCASLGLRRLDP